MNYAARKFSSSGFWLLKFKYHQIFSEYDCLKKSFFISFCFCLGASVVIRFPYFLL